MNTFAATVLRIEAERRAEAEAAVAAGWTEADHPHKCCPHLVEAKPEPRQPASLEWYEARVRGAKQRAARLEAKIAKLTGHKQAERRPDFGEVNIPWTRNRERAAESAVSRGVEYARAVQQLEQARISAAVWQRKLEVRKDAA